MDDLLKFSRQPQLNEASLVIGWSSDAGRIGANVTSYLIDKLGGEKFCDIDPVEFFSLGGASIENDIVQFPESKFYSCSKNNLILLRSVTPYIEWYKFLNLVLDVAEKYRVREIYVVGGMISLGAHTNPREITGTCNNVEIKRTLDPYKVVGDLNYESPAGQKPTFNSFLLWAAQKRGIAAVSLWIPVPFYLVNVGDYLAHKILVDFFNRRFNLNLDMDDIKNSHELQNVKISEARRNVSEINEFINRLEANMTLTDEENQKLLYELENYLNH